MIEMTITRVIRFKASLCPNSWADDISNSTKANA